MKSAPRASFQSRIWTNLLLLVAGTGLVTNLLLRPPAPELARLPEARNGLLLVGKSRDTTSLLRGGLAIPSPWDLARVPVVTQMDYPLGSETGALTYNARPFREVEHLGDDLNGIGGQNSDLGDGVYAAADGLVIVAGESGGGWGKVVILQHRDNFGDFFQTFYGHLERIDAQVGQIVSRGTPVGAVGTANGQYYAHLHFELRRGFPLDLGSGYSPFSLNRENPEERLRFQARSAPSKLHGAPGNAAK